MKFRLSFFSVFPATVFFFVCICAQSQQTLIHSHNDYQQPVPFYQAHACGANSIEADIFSSGTENELLVAHHATEFSSSRTFDNLYLKPVVEVFKRNQGKAWAASDNHLQLLIDLKTPVVPTLDILVSKLNAYPEVFDPAVNPDAVRVVISGNRPDPADFSKYPSYIYFDGRINQTYTQEELSRVPLFSEPFSDCSKWDGEGAIIDSEKKALEALIQKAHSLGKPIRFWGAPDTITAWKVLSAMGIDFINTDQPEACTNFFRE